jgi:hypothetical protein
MVDYLCPCNSGRKFKVCCGDPKRALNPVIVNKLLAALVNHLNNKTCVPCSLLDTMPKDVALQIQYSGKDESYYLQLVKIPEPQKIVVPKRELIIR